MSDGRFTESDLGGLGLTPEELEAIADADHPQENAPAPTGTPFVFTPTYTGPPMAQLDAMAEDLDRQLEDGDIDILEYTKLRDPIVQHRFEATIVHRAHESNWRQEQDQFFAANPEFQSDPALNGALQQVFKSLDTQENSHKTGSELLDEARRKIEESAARVLRERGDYPTGGRSGRDTAGQSDFAYLDRLEGAALEAALSKLTAEEAERYLRGV